MGKSYKNREEERGKTPERGYEVENSSSSPLKKENRSLLGHKCLTQYQLQKQKSYRLGIKR